LDALDSLTEETRPSQAEAEKVTCYKASPEKLARMAREDARIREEINAMQARWREEEREQQEQQERREHDEPLDMHFPTMYG